MFDYLLFRCPVCGTIHRNNPEEDTLFECMCCRQFFIAGEDGSLRALTPLEKNDLDNGRLEDLPTRFRFKEGIRVPIMDGGWSNLLVDDTWFHIPAGFSLQDLSYTEASLREGGKLPDAYTMKDLLMAALPKETWTVDMAKLRVLVGGIDWERVKGFFTEEKGV